jgi:hypothetical protein
VAVSANNIVRWDSSTDSWSVLGSGTSSGVYALAWDGTNLYAGGAFSSAGGTSAISIARWDSSDSTWYAMGSGMNNIVWSLAWDGTNLYAGGDFTIAGGVAANRIARWDGATWSALGGGTNAGVYALAWDGDSLYSSLYAGGLFVSAGAKPSSHIGRWRLAAIWDGGGGDNNGSTDANWSGDSVPLATDVAIFDSTSSKQALLDADFPASLHGLVIEESYSGVVAQSADLALAEDLHIHGGRFVVADPAVHSFTVGGDVWHTGGTLQQTRPVDSTGVSFLQIEDGAANVKYRGVDVETAVNLGNVTVTVRAIDMDNDEYCTDDGVDSPDYAERCYTIAPGTNGPALVRLWALTSELNGIDEDDLAVYRHSGSSTWTPADNRDTGNDGAYSYAEGNVLGFSAFLLGDVNEAPTAVSLQSIMATTPNGQGGIIILLVALLAALSGAWLWFPRRRLVPSGD